MNTDDLFRKMQEDELADAAKLTPREYAKLKGMSPQLVYYHIRAGHLKTETCLCGRTVLDVAEANGYFNPKNVQEET